MFDAAGTFSPPGTSLLREAAVNEDAALIEEALGGRPAAFGQLVLKYQDRLYNTVYHVVGNAEDAKDVVQDAFVQAFVKLETFRQTGAFFGWLYRIAFNVAATRHRRRHPTVSLERLRAISGCDPVAGGNGPVEEAEGVEHCRLVREAIAALEEEYRVVLVLREIDGCCYERIAEILDLPLGTVRSRLHRARLKLRDLLQDAMIVRQPRVHHGQSAGKRTA
jgi:RNA polymerase sigma-70 factor (ECF subfamily)